MIVANYLLSGTLRSTLDYILIDRSNRDLLNDDKISREKSGPVSLFVDEFRTSSYHER